MTPYPANLDLLLELEDCTDAIGRALGELAGELARSGLEAAGVAHADPRTVRASIAQQLATIQLRHTELRALLWTHSEAFRKASEP